MAEKLKRCLWAIPAILAGNFLLAFAVTAFAVPHGIIMGGVTGIGIALHQLTGADMAITVFVLNAVSLICGGLILGRQFFYMTAASSVIYPVFLAMTERFPDVAKLTSDPVLASIIGGCLIGFALGLVFRVGASSGGTDALNLVLSKWTRYPVSVFVYLVDAAILLWQAFYVTTEYVSRFINGSTAAYVLYGIVLLVIETVVLEQVMVFGQSQIQMFIITKRYETVRMLLLRQLNAGVTMVLTENGYLQQPCKGVLCVIPPRKLHAAKELIESVDRNAFLTITKVKEVHGRGFTLERRVLSAKQDENIHEKKNG